MKGLSGTKIRPTEVPSKDFQFVINRDFDTKKIEELKRKNVQHNKVIRIISKATNLPTPLVRVFTSEKLTHETCLCEGITLGYQIFKCELPREKPLEVKQCFKRNEFNHVAKDSKTTQRGANAEESTTGNNAKPTYQKGGNCGENHPSSYKGCKARVEEIQTERNELKEAQIAKFPPPRAEVDEQIRELEERCQNLEKDLEKMGQIVIERETSILELIKNSLKTTLTTEEQKAEEEALIKFCNLLLSDKYKPEPLFPPKK